MSDWDAAQYLKFQKERTQPAIDLANRIGAEVPKKIVDIGCGPGNSTQVLLDRFPQARIIGVDDSEGMIEAAKRQHPGATYVVGDAAGDLSMLGGGFDIAFSNACIQWIPDHPRLLRSLIGLLKPGGVLAVQVPINFEEPIHRIIVELVASDKWKGSFPHPRIFYTLSAGAYYDLLSELGGEVDLWTTTYCHVMRSHADIMEWYRSTGLRPYLAVLDEEKKRLFEQDVLRLVEKAYPPRKNGSILFRFPRLFFTVRH